MNNHSARSRSKSNGKRAVAKKKDASPASPPEGKRERILEAAIKVFAAEGFYNAKVSQIAQAAGVADGTIYLYFKSKDDLLINLFEDRMERVNANLREAIETETSAIAQLRRIVRLHLELVEQNRDMAEVISVELRQSSKFIREYANPKFAEFLRTIAGAVVEGQRTGELRTGIDPYIFARALFGALDEIALAWLVKQPGSKATIELPRAAEQLGDLFIDGLKAR
ncbi:MAG: Fatty acid degradation regulator YsiA, TetR family [Myxococcales bacterium]|nr:Fatty acid degradation regulator YsiA, TetR family [Myxococcales bacterium]